MYPFKIIIGEFKHPIILFYQIEIHVNISGDPGPKFSHF